MVFVGTSLSFLLPIYIHFKFEYQPLIVAVTPFFGEPFINASIKNALEKCPFKCQISDNIQLYPDADAAIFHLVDMKWDNFYNLKRNPFRLNIFFNLEPFPQISMKDGFPPDFFNVSMTFRKDSTIWRPYDIFQPILLNEKTNSNLVWTDGEIEKMLKLKTKLAVQFVSHCHTQSQRETFIPKLQKLSNITVYGKCNQTNDTKLLRGTIEELDELQKHFFYFAFENSICKDYVTEKFWRLKQLIVPVVLKRSILQGLIDNENFIAVDDFNSIAAFIDRLNYLSKNITEYKKYLSWTKKYKKTIAYEDKEFCKICEMAVNREKHFIDNIYDWWENRAECYDNFLNKYF